MKPRFLFEQIRVLKCGCWKWLGRRSRNGYGRIRLDGREVSAHRLVYRRG